MAKRLTFRETLKVIKELRDADLDLKSTAGWKEMLLGGTTESGIKIDEETSLKYSAVWAATRIRSETRASIPVMIYKNTDDSKEKDKNHPLYRMLAFSPNPWMNYFDFWFLNNLYLDLWGNAYHVIYKKRGDKFASALIPIHPSDVEPKIESGKKIYIISGNTGYDGTYKDKDIVHFKGLSTNGIKGKSPITLAKESLGLGLAAEKFGARYFGKDGVLRAVIESPNPINDEAYTTLAKRWRLNKDHDTAILDRGMTIKSIGIDPEAAQFLQTRQFQLQDVARWFNVPPSLLADLTQSRFRNVEQQDLFFSKYTIRPILKRDENELEVKLLGKDWPEFNIKWNLDAIVRGDMAARSSYYASGIQNEWLSKNEVRTLEDMNPYPGGDEFKNPNINVQDE